MAVYTFKELITGDTNILDYYQRAQQLWEEIKQSDKFTNVDTLAKELSFVQTQFELECGGRMLGQEIMTFVGIGQFYSIASGFEDRDFEDAIKVKNAFARSNCSLEVKWHAEEAAKIFGLSENEEL